MQKNTTEAVIAALETSSEVINRWFHLDPEGAEDAGRQNHEAIELLRRAASLDGSAQDSEPKVTRIELRNAA